MTFLRLAMCVSTALLLAMGCGQDALVPFEEPPGCELDATECRADGLYRCDESGGFVRIEACAKCEATPSPRCTASCGDAGITSVCDGSAVKDCATGMPRTCEPGACLQAGTQAVCGTKPGAATCQGRRQDGSQYLLACVDDGAISTTQACDRRTSTCVASTFDCAKLTTVPAGSFACDKPSGDYFSSCTLGQPSTLACGPNTACGEDGTLNCYTASTAGIPCGGPAVCPAGLACQQTSASAPTCVSPATIVGCGSTSRYAFCFDADTAAVCVRGAVWAWRNLSTWGGACARSHVDVGVGGTCIPGLADCTAGLECYRSRFDVAGVCRTPEPTAPAECILTGQASVGRTCIYEWNTCRDGHRYKVDCRPVNIGGVVLSSCACSRDGVTGNSFGSIDFCSSTTVAMLDARTRTSCGWPITTTEIAE